MAWRDFVRSLNEDGGEFSFPNIWIAVPIAGLLLGFVGIWFSTEPNLSSRFLLVFGSLSLFAFGALIGFFFGVPRVGQQAGSAGSSVTSASLTPNTNLEQISDWITKIVLGLGLVELYKIGPAIRDLSAYFAPAVDGKFNSQVLIEITFSYFPIVGFFQGYLSTRLFLSSLFRRADQELVNKADKALLELSGTVPLSKIDERDTKVAMSSKVRRAAEDVSRLKLEDLRDPDDILAWSRAQMALNRPEIAVRGYRRLVELSPRDPQIRAEYAGALMSDGSESLAEYETALRDLKPSTEPLVRTSIYENILSVLAGVDPPIGFSKAIQYGEKFAKTGDVTDSDTFWFNLALVYGQKYRWLAENDSKNTDLPSVRKKALDAIKRAVALEANNKRLFAEYMLSNDRNFDPKDNDLQAFERDQDFIDAIS
jgi:hypothetical protein